MFTFQNLKAFIVQYRQTPTLITIFLRQTIQTPQTLNALQCRSGELLHCANDSVQAMQLSCTQQTQKLTQVVSAIEDKSSYTPVTPLRTHLHTLPAGLAGNIHDAALQLPNSNTRPILASSFRQVSNSELILTTLAKPTTGYLKYGWFIQVNVNAY